MHPCLHIDELLESIAAEVSSGGTRELVAMALTCQVFYEPAMNRLWRDLPGLVPLISCLPRARLSRTRTRGGFDPDFDYSVSNALSHCISHLIIAIAAQHRRDTASARMGASAHPCPSRQDAIPSRSKQLIHAPLFGHSMLRDPKGTLSRVANAPQPSLVELPL